MFYLFTQTFFWLLAAFVLGLLIGWWLKSKLTDTQVREVYLNESSDVEAPSQADIIPDSWAPQQLFDSNTTDADDLKQIKGVGSKIEVLLNTLGIYQFSQIASMTDNNVAWINDKLGFSGRIEREAWVDQARLLADGGETEFSRRVVDGKVDYNKDPLV